MARYLITQSLLSSWLYIYECREEKKDEAMASFLHALRREPEELDDKHRKYIQNGIDFEAEVYAEAAGKPRAPHPKWEQGVQQIAAQLKGAQFQVRVSREIEIAGITFLVYGILDALHEGVISDVKFKNDTFHGLDLAGDYLDSPQHPLYFFMVPEARLFRYMVSDGQDLYIEQYEPEDCPSAADLILQFVQFLKANNLMDTYLQHWQARS